MNAPPIPLPAYATEPMVGLFWLVEQKLVAVGKPLRFADTYGDNLTYDGGHYEHWNQWQSAGAIWLGKYALPLAILHSEYDEHPRGRVIYGAKAGMFRVYADLRLHNAASLRQIRSTFGLSAELTSVIADSHYR